MRVKKYNKGDRTWLSENFKACEMDCKCNRCSDTLIDDKLIDILQKVRTHIGKPLNINSGYRCPEHNREVGGASRSYHMKGMAADVMASGVKPIEIAKYAESIGVKGIGLYSNFVHLDTRTEKSFWYSHNEEPRETFGGKPIETPSEPSKPDNSDKIKALVSDIDNKIEELKKLI